MARTKSFLVRALPIQTSRDIAVVTEYAVSRRIPLFFKPPVEVGVLEFPAVFTPSSMDVVDRQELIFRLAATCARRGIAAIMNNSGMSQTAAVCQAFLLDFGSVRLSPS